MKAYDSGRRRTSPWLSTLLSLFLLAFLLGGIYSGFVFYRSVQALVAHYRLPQVVVPPEPEEVITPPPRAAERHETPERIVVEPPRPKEHERVNILLLGSDRRKVERGPSRTDTIILVSLDPQSRTAVMLSIPRDLWVPIPGYGENRINTAYFYGGPTLTKRTVQYNLGVPVHYYVLLYFDGFKKIVDLLGGITVDVKRPIYDTKYPDEAYGYTTIYIPAGVQQMDGEQALQYARTRHNGTDFERMRRQQEVLLAIRAKALSLKGWLLPKAPQLWRAMGDTMETDLELKQALNLVPLATQIELEQVKMASIDASMTVPVTTSTGANVLWLDREGAAHLMQELFYSPQETSLNEKEIRIEVQNGTTQQDLAARAAAYLRQQGYQVMGFDNADRNDYGQTLVIDYTADGRAGRYVAQRLRLNEASVQLADPKDAHEADVRLILGKDFRLPAD